MRIKSLVAFSLLSFITFSRFKSVKSDEEDYPFGEFAADVGAGIAISRCEMDPECKESVGGLMMMSLFVFGILSCCGCIDENTFEEDKMSRKKAIKRGSSVGMGYAVGRLL
tara:strand:+ start:198 stop:530 length:333 start_codon:yes stop_codon:yes gene_type:complete